MSLVTVLLLRVLVAVTRSGPVWTVGDAGSILSASCRNRISQMIAEWPRAWEAMHRFACLPRLEALDLVEDIVANSKVAPAMRPACLRYLMALWSTWPRLTTLWDDVGAEPRSARDFAALVTDRIPQFVPGQRLRGLPDLQLCAFLGKGGFAENWVAEHPRARGLGRKVVKLFQHEEARPLSAHEATICSEVLARNPKGVVPLQGTYLGGDPPGLTYQLIPGVNLAEFLQAARRSPHRPSPEAIARLILRVAQILAQVHPFVAHRDVKPTNILITRAPGGHWVVYLTDFGIAGRAQVLTVEEWELSAHSEAVIMRVLLYSGSRPYASPQQRAQELPAVTDDVYSLGVTWGEALLGTDFRPEAEGPLWRVSAAARGAWPEYVQVMESMVARDPRQRPADGTAVVEQIAELI